MNKQRDIKPCPFCGGKAKIGLIVSTVNCLECGARAGEYNVGYKAIEAWNKRAENKELEGLFKFQVKENCRIASQLNEVEDSRDELLDALKELMTKAELLISSFSDGKAVKVYNTIILKATILKEKQPK